MFEAVLADKNAGLASISTGCTGNATCPVICSDCVICFCRIFPTDRPKSVRNRFVIDFWATFLLSLCFLEFSVGVRAFVKGISQISSFFFQYQPWCHGTSVCSWPGVFGRRFHTGLADISGPTSCSTALRSLSFAHRSLNAYKQNRESTEGYSMWNVGKWHDKFGKTGPTNWSISKSPKGERNHLSGQQIMLLMLTSYSFRIALYKLF